MDSASGESSPRCAAAFENPKFTIKLFTMIQEVQQQHGLRHGDYQRYRQFCARRLNRIHRALRFPQASVIKVNPRVVKSKAQPKKVSSLPQPLKDVRFLHLLVFEAERCWSAAQQLKQESQTEPRKRHHMNSRLRKAVSYSKELLSLSESHCDARSRLECQAYCSWIEGNMNFERRDWKSALDNLQIAVAYYEKLSASLLANQAGTRLLFAARLDELRAMLRYCAYQMGDRQAAADLFSLRNRLDTGASAAGAHLLLSKLDVLISETQRVDSESLSEIVWCGQSVPAAPQLEAVRTLQLSLQTSSNKPSGPMDVETDAASHIAILEGRLKLCNEATQAVRDEMRRESAGAGAGSGKARALKPGEKALTNLSTAALELLLSYVSFVRLSASSERGLLIIDEVLSQAQRAEGERAADRPAATRSKGKRSKAQMEATASATAAAAATAMDEAGAQSKALARGGQKYRREDTVRLYDSVAQNLNEMATLLKQQGSEAANLLESHISLQLAAATALKYLYMAEALASNHRFFEAMCVLDRTRQVASNAQIPKTKAPAELPHFVSRHWPLDEATLKRVAQQAAVRLYLYYSQLKSSGADLARLSAAETVSLATTPSSDVGEAERFDESLWRLAASADVDATSSTAEATRVLSQLAGGELLRQPPLLPVPWKPAFFDIAGNFLAESLPDLSDRLPAASGAGEQQQGGLRGFVRSFWGWRGGSQATDSNVKAKK